MKRKVLTIGLVLVALTVSLMIGPLVGARPNAATDDEIEQAITDGVAWLVSQQGSDGSWVGHTAKTCFALVKLEEYAYELAEKYPELGIESPFDLDYAYADNVVHGWEYIFGAPRVYKQTPLSVQVHNGNSDDPDTNGNGYGLYFDSGHRTYSTGICMMALAASGTPDRPNGGGLDFNGDGSPDTFKEIAREAVDWLAFAQGDFGNGEGGWDYWGLDNAASRAEDNSNSGYAVLGLAYGEGFGCTVPDWVKTELDVWIGNVQDPVNGDTDDGGSWYRPKQWSWVNELKTGNLIFEMTFVGDHLSTQRFQDALDYIELHWRDQNIDPGWGYNRHPASYQAMYCLMKGLRYSVIDLLDTDGDGERDDDWLNQEPPASPAQDFASVLVAQQNPDGSWPGNCHWGDPVLCTTWALLTLEEVAPPPPVVSVDIKPGSCPNPFNTKNKGVLPVAVLGTEDFDVTTIDPATIQLTREGYEVGVSPLRWDYEDVATPFKGEPCECHDLNGDGYADLTLKFDTQEVKDTLDLEAEAGNTIPLLVTGNLKEEAGGRPIKGSDCVWVLTGKK